MLQGSIRIPNWFALMTALSFYTAIGILFVLPSPTLRLCALVIVLLAWRLPRVSLKVIASAALVASLIEWATGKPIGVAAWSGVGWASVVGVILAGITIYPRILKGAHVASIAVLFGRRRGTNVAHTAFMLYRVVPDLEMSIHRIADAFRVYGRRARDDTWYSTVTLLLDGFIIYFLEAINILLVHERIAVRRRPILFDAARSRHTMPVLAILGTWLFSIGTWLALWLSQLHSGA